MKVYSCPSEVPAPRVNYTNYDRDKALADETQHKADLTEYFRRKGYRGPNSGKTISFPVADGAAEYLLIEGRTSFLIHLPYLDAYQYRDVAFLPKTEILKRIKQEERFSKLFR